MAVGVAVHCSEFFPFFMLVHVSQSFKEQKNLHVACRSYTVINKIFSVRVAVSGFDTISTAQPYIYVANHQCNYDVLIVAEALKPGTVIVGKKIT
ncbi:1-acyl-sn-glycerol-3-phosphate acyltransferase [Pseudomonas lini]